MIFTDRTMTASTIAPMIPSVSMRTPYPWERGLYESNDRSRKYGRSVLPLRDEEIRIPFLRIAAIGRPDDAAAIGTEHGKAVELLVVRDLLEPRAIEVDQEQLEVPASGVLVVGGENDPASIGRPRRSEVGAAERGDLALITAVGVHHP